MPAFQAAIFDLDGVLVDTAEFHYLAWKQIADELHIPFDRRKNDRLRGVPRMASLDIILEDLPIKPANLDALASRKNSLYVDMIQRLTPADLLPGVRSLLESLHQARIPLALGSSSKNAKTVLKLLQIDSLFSAIVDGFGFENPKPAPDIFLNAARLINVPPAHCVVVEDAQSGIDAAKAARMYALGISPNSSLQGADLLLQTPAQIPLSLWLAPTS